MPHTPTFAYFGARPSSTRRGTARVVSMLGFVDPPIHHRRRHLHARLESGVSAPSFLQWAAHVRPAFDVAELAAAERRDT